jgi:hypothetical protein
MGATKRRLMERAASSISTFDILLMAIWFFRWLINKPERFGPLRFLEHV